MGFLDRMVSNAIRRSTGVNAHRVVRKVGAGKLLLLGGAAIAGAVAMEKMGKRQASPAGPYKTGSDGSTDPPKLPKLPPLPPLPSIPSPVPPPPAARAVIPPPSNTLPPNTVPSAPPADMAGQEARDDELPPELNFSLVRTMVAASLADGELTGDERELIDSQLLEGGLTDGQVARVRREMVVPAEPEELAVDLGVPEHAEAAYRAALLVLKADGEIAEPEERWLNRLGEALQLSAERRRELEADLLGVLGVRSG